MNKQSSFLAFATPVEPVDFLERNRVGYIKKVFVLDGKNYPGGAWWAKDKISGISGIVCGPEETDPFRVAMMAYGSCVSLKPHGRGFNVYLKTVRDSERNPINDPQPRKEHNP